MRQPPYYCISVDIGFYGCIVQARKQLAGWYLYMEEETKTGQASTLFTRLVLCCRSLDTTEKNSRANLMAKF